MSMARFGFQVCECQSKDVPFVGFVWGRADARAA